LIPHGTERGRQPAKAAVRWSVVGGAGGLGAQGHGVLAGGLSAQGCGVLASGDIVHFWVDDGLLAAAF
jgi:hypothetical protein